MDGRKVFFPFFRTGRRVTVRIRRDEEEIMRGGKLECGTDRATVVAFI